MLFKNLQSSSSLLLTSKDLIANKLLNDIYFSKSYLKDVLTTNDNTKLFLGDSNLKYVSVYKDQKDVISNFGRSFITANKNFKYNEYNTLKFSLDFSLLNNKTFPIISSLFTSIHNFVILKNFEKASMFNSLLILKSIKGGFICFSDGLFGFLPNSQFKLSKKSIQNLFKHFFNKKKNVDSLFFSQIRYFFFRFPVFLGKFNIQFIRRKFNSFSVTKRLKPYRFSFNFIFLVTKPKLIKKNLEV